MGAPPSDGAARVPVADKLAGYSCPVCGGEVPRGRRKPYTYDALVCATFAYALAALERALRAVLPRLTTDAAAHIGGRLFELRNELPRERGADGRYRPGAR